MKKVRIKDLEFELSITSESIQAEIDRVAAQINEDYQGTEVLFLGILNGSFMFVADLLKRIEVVSQLSFLKIASYEGMNSSGVSKELIGINENLNGRHIVVIEDIVDTGKTMIQILQQLTKYAPASIRVATLLYKPDACKVDLKIDYTVFTIPNDFIVGYGLDYDGYGRNLPEIYTVVK
ncbi:MAG: hypoxanthine phosphoribosyltransferase [Bacteroidota bacterium]|jgi:hypoxanthine phosphoribosyltransferase